MNLEERVRTLQSTGDDDAAKQLVRAAISNGGSAEYRFEGDRIRVEHPSYTGMHEVRRRPYGEPRVVARGDYRFRGEEGSVNLELAAVNSAAVRFGRERIREAERANAPGTASAASRRGRRGDNELKP